MSGSFQDIDTWNEATIINSHLCRICFSLTDLLIPIFEGEGIEQELRVKVQKYLPVKILPSDTFSQKLCYPCARTLIAWDSLYTICLKTEEILKTHLKEEGLSEIYKEKINSCSEPFMPPENRKLRGLKNKSKNSTKFSIKTKKNKSKILFYKKIQGVKNKSDNNSENKMNDRKEKSVINSEADVSVKCSFTEEENLLTVIKTKQESEEDKVNSSESNTGYDLPDSYSVKCEFCQKSYKSKKCLNRHMKKFHDKSEMLKVQKCSLCSNLYKTKANLEKHYLKEHLTDQVQCPVCHNSFNSKKLDFHLKSAHGVKTESENEEKFKCKMCEKWFKNKYVRNSHMKETHLSETMKCKLCDFEGVRTVLRRHKRDVHAEKKFMCSLCPGAFKTLHTLKMHMTSHSDIRCYTCDICGMGFKRLNNVRDHMKCHEEKSNQCQICGNFFARKRYLAIHEKTIHNFYADGIVPEEKSFECGICGAKLKWKKNLLAHMRIHTGEKPYVCKICNKDFVCHGSLRTHMAKHSVCIINENESQGHISVTIFNNVTSEQV